MKRPSIRTFVCEIATEASVAAVYELLSTARGLSTWWGVRVEDDPGVGAVVELPLADARIRIRVDRLEENSLVMWSCLGGVAEWDGSSIRFDLAAGERTTVRLEHRGWQFRRRGGVLERADFSWPRQLVRLRALVPIQ